MIRVVLPQHLQTLARVQGEVELQVAGPATQRAVLDALEASDKTRKRDDPANDKTLSPFFCSPVNK